jgi:hypothetical protein
MAQSLARVLIHLVFSTKHRAPLLPQTPFAALHAYAHGIFEKQKCHLIEMNNVSDHVHALFGGWHAHGFAWACLQALRRIANLGCSRSAAWRPAC